MNFKRSFRHIQIGDKPIGNICIGDKPIGNIRIGDKPIGDAAKDRKVVRQGSFMFG